MTSRTDDIDAVTVPVDTSKLGRIVENLLANVARRSSPRTTTGRAADLREAIFEPFRQDPSSSQHSSGTGIDLTFVARFTRAARRSGLGRRAQRPRFVPGVVAGVQGDRSTRGLLVKRGGLAGCAV
jgi:hypothetical protein